MMHTNKPVVALFDEVAWQISRAAFANEGMKLLRSRPEQILTTLSRLAEHQAFFVVREFPYGRGLAGFARVSQEVLALRKICPTVGLVFISDQAASFRQAALPPLTWILHPEQLDIAPMLEQVRYFKSEQCSQFRDVQYHGDLPSDEMNTLRLSNPPRTSFITPNYNIKHASMLVPLALASAHSQRPIFCEISPQEALTFSRNTYNHDTRHMVNQSLTELRNAIHQINRHFNSSLKLHLDHCDDLHIIEHAAAIGFDSIMADGSARGLEQNIAFTRRASRMLARSGIPVEGEIGHIDGTGPRRWNKTRINDLLHFVDATEVDFVGVHIGQFHSFSYDYQSSRHHHASIVGTRTQAGSHDWNAFLSACMEIDHTLEQQGFNRNSPPRRLIAQCGLQALDGGVGGPASVNLLLNKLAATVPFYQQPILTQLEQKWLAIRLEKLTLQSKHWSGMFPDGQEKPDMRRARIDFGLLSELSTALKHQRSTLVIHGGSSIEEDDLPLFSQYKIARINFGSDVFSDYLGMLAAEHPPGMSQQLSSHLGKMAFLDEVASGWESWLKDTPPAIDLFAARIMNKHLAVMPHPARVKQSDQQEEVLC